MDFTLYNQIGNLLDWLLPARCIRCGGPVARGSVPSCGDCYVKLPFQDHACARCGQAYTGLTDHCGRCLSAPPDFDRCFCPFEYRTPISDQILRLKYCARPELAKPIAKLMAQEVSAQLSAVPDLLIPVPMHISRLRQRGYNQSGLLARHLGKRLNIPVAYDAIVKSKPTQRQAQLSLKQRKHNLRGSFSIGQRYPAKSVAIVDDVVTTGATAGEISKILKKNGVDYVQVWGVAHTL